MMIGIHGSAIFAIPAKTAKTQQFAVAVDVGYRETFDELHL